VQTVTPYRQPGQTQQHKDLQVGLFAGETPWLKAGHAGVDEVGIGPLAGPVVAAAVLLDPSRPIDALQDSKTLSSKKREQLAPVIRDQAVAWALGWASVAEVDALNVLRASHLAMQRAVADLSTAPTMIWIDGNKTPSMPVPCRAVVQGDKIVPAISAASILAKVARDAYMAELEEGCPGYGFAQHKGYPTRAHLAALNRLGVSAHHRTSYAPVRKVLESA